MEDFIILAYRALYFIYMSKLPEVKESQNNSEFHPSKLQCCGQDNKHNLRSISFWLVLLPYVPSQQLWSLRDGQFT